LRQVIIMGAKLLFTRTVRHPLSNERANYK
jgi:hypothetical protein